MRHMLVASVALGLVIVGAASSGPPSTVTTVMTVKGGVAAIALDGTKIAWFPAQSTCPSLHLLDAVTKHDNPVRLQQRDCDDPSWALHDRLAIAGNQVLYGLRANGNTESGVELFVADARTGKTRLVGSVAIPGGHDANDPYVPVPMDGADGLLAFGELSSDSLSDRVVYRVDGTTPLSLTTTSGVKSLDLDAGRLAVTRTLPAGCICNGKARVSPDGKRIAFVSGQWPGGSADGQRSVYVVNSDGTGLQRLGEPGQVGTNPVWSPDGSAVAYTRFATHTIVVEVPGGTRTELGDGETPSWSPNGKQLAFISSDPKTSTNYAVIVNRDGTGRRLVIKADGVEWSPSGNQLVIDGANLRLVSTDGKTARVLHRGVFPTTWSPDGTRIAFQGVDFRSIFVIRVKDGALTRLAVGGGGNPRWAPDGIHLAYEVVDPKSVTSGSSSATWSRAVWVTAADGSSAPVKLAQGSEPDWSQDGNLVFTRPLANRPDAEIATVALDGTGVRNVTRTRPAAAQTVVEVRSAEGKLLSHVSADATSVLLSGRLLVDRAATGLEVRNASTAALVRTLPIPAGTGAMVLAGRWLVYVAGRSVRLVDTRTGKTSVLTTTSGPVVGLSASGSRVAWAEQGKSSRIRTTLLPE